MPASRSGAWRRIVAGALLACAALFRPPAAAATTATFEVNDQAVIQVIGRVATIAIRTWNRNAVQVEWPDGQPYETSRATLETHGSFLIPAVIVDENTVPGAPPDPRTLLPEDFPVPGLTPGAHDLVRIRQTGAPVESGKAAMPSRLIVTIPASAGLVNVRSTRGTIVLTDYHGTTIAAILHGHIVMRNVSGDAFVQPLNGRFYAHDSTFDRLRIRSNHADEVFDECRVKQIEATTLTGDIVFDNGVFDAGLARFESDRGSIALGVNGGAQLGAHTRDGRVLTVLPPNQPPPSVFGNASTDSEGDALAYVGNGGPLVNASSVHGNVLLYDGSLTDRRPGAMAAEWRPVYDLLVAARETARPVLHPKRRR